MKPSTDTPPPVKPRSKRVLLVRDESPIVRLQTEEGTIIYLLPGEVRRNLAPLAA